MCKIRLFLVTFSLFYGGWCAPSKNLNEVVEIDKVIQQNGYPLEIHEVETEDGYLLTIHRIPFGKDSNPKSPNKYPVVINHGLMASAEHSLIGGPKRAIAYILADHGYDVWLLNCRGTWHSRKHKFLDPDKNKEFWHFSLHEIGYYDLPGTIDYILKLTGKKKLHFVGHSQGTTTFFIMASTKPEYNDKIFLMLAMAPSAFLSNHKIPLLWFIAPLYKMLQRLADVLNIYELLPKNILSNEVVRNATRRICVEDARNDICSFLLYAVTMYTADQIDPVTIPFIVSSTPGGSSVYQALHYAQIITTGKFQQYDWGRNENIRRYGSAGPPLYDLQNVRAPVSLLYGESDTIVTKKDVAILAKSLPNVVDMYKVPYEKWTHFDFIWAKDIVKLLLNHVMELMMRYKS